jgi:ferrochelatase
MSSDRKRQTAVLLVNLGTPDSPSTRDVRVYLRQFLMDGRVIDIPGLSRFLLVNCVIAPLRASESAKAYRKLWRPEGSPLKIYGFRNQARLQEILPDGYQVFFATRYQNPGVPSVVGSMEKQGFEEIIVLPLFPQYASASTGSAVEEVLRAVSRWTVIPDIKVISRFFDHPLFIATFVRRAREMMDKTSYDHSLFSYHGLPERQISKSSRDGYCRAGECCSSMNRNNRFCYRAQCMATTRLIAGALGLEEGRFSTSFQSRLGRDPWIRPYTDETIRDLRARGVKKLLVFSPAFVADCLETTVEIGHEYKHQFTKDGGEMLDLVESCNDHPVWMECLKSLVLEA